MSEAIFTHPVILRAKNSAQTEFNGRLEQLGQYRLTSERTHFEHLEEVATLLAEAALPPAVIAAGYLHDHELLGSNWSFGRMEREFGSSVALLVAWSTRHDDSLPPHLRHELHLTQIITGPGEAVSVSCAEQISILRQLNVLVNRKKLVGPRLLRRWQAELLFFSRLTQIYSSRVPEYLRQEYEKSFSEFELHYLDSHRFLNGDGYESEQLIPARANAGES